MRIQISEEVIFNVNIEILIKLIANLSTCFDRENIAVFLYPSCFAPSSNEFRTTELSPS